MLIVLKEEVYNMGSCMLRFQVGSCFLRLGLGGYMATISYVWHEGIVV
jgi:hypothetical protein